MLVHQRPDARVAHIVGETFDIIKEIHVKVRAIKTMNAAFLTGIEIGRLFSTSGRSSVGHGSNLPWSTSFHFVANLVHCLLVADSQLLLQTLCFLGRGFGR